MKKIICIILFFISAGNCFGQQVTFQKVYGSAATGTSVEQTMDGGYIIAGYMWGFQPTDADILLVKTDANGDTVWTKSFGGWSDEYAFCVRQTSDSGYIMVGQSIGDIFLIKADANGDTLWTKTFGGTNDDQGHSIQQTSDGGFIITGSTRSFGAGTFDVFLVKTDANGNIIWEKTIGDVNDDFGNSVQQTTDGGYIIAGSTGTDAYLIKIDLNGNLQWSKTFGGSMDDYAAEVKQTTDGGYIITGATNSFSAAGDNDVYLIKSDSSGNLQWSKTFGGTDYDRSSGIRQTPDGGYIIAGTTYSFGSGNYDVYLIKTDASGDMLWTKTYGGTGGDFGNSLCQTTDGGFVITGQTSLGSGGFYLIKTDSSGNSFCNEGGTTTILTNPATQVSTPANIPVIFTPVVTSPTIIINTWCPVTTLCTSVGIQSSIPNPPSAITISPNPATNNFTITFPNTINKGVIEIYNVMGEKIFKEDVFNVSQKEIRLKNIGAGIYFVKVRVYPVLFGNGEKEYCEKLVIE